ncbi:MAG: AAA family ATPase [Pseudomonadales bacterium]|nr:AAA family ATPase [Pseudomonadales bacterium]
MSEQHQDALAHLLYGIQEGEGFVLLTGDIGTGKTTLCRSLLEQTPDYVEVAYIFNPKLSALELLLSICDEFKVPLNDEGRSLTIKQAIDKINGYLLDQHSRNRHSVLIIDEAQNLSTDVLEQIRLLTNLETNSKKLLQIILIGQPELRDVFQKPELEQLAQRITARFHIGPLTLAELEHYLSHRIYIAGGSKRPLFNKGAIKTLHKLTRGIPRLINTVSDRALLAAYVHTRSQVTKEEIVSAAAEILNKPTSTRKPSPYRNKILASSLAVSLALAFSLYMFAPKIQRYFLAVILDSQAVTQGSAYSVPATAPPQKPLSSYETGLTGNRGGAITESPSIDQQPTLVTETVSISAKELRFLARQALLTRWSLDSPFKPGDDFCAFAENHELRCLKGSHTLANLIKLNRPAVIQLTGEGSQQYFATINKVTDQEVELIIGGLSQTLSLDDLESSWTGQFELLWRPPFQYSEGISAKSSATSIQWFRHQLDVAASKPESNLPIYIAPIDMQIRLFQRETGLETDGVAGPETIITINTLSNAPSPLLTTLNEAS